ncbi:MAG: AraC family ligand binding domain-containing protein [Planctomycetota bacterium]
MPSRDPEDAILVRSLGLELPPDQRLDAHAHPWGQLVLATDGVLAVETERGGWVVPPRRAVWIGAGFLHSVRATGRVRMRTLYLRPDLAEPLQRACCVVPVSPLLRELALEVLRRGMLRDDEPAEARLAAVVVDQLRATEEVPLRVDLPSDVRARRVADAVRSDLARRLPLADLVRGSGASVRTVERLFVAQTGLTFRAWSSVRATRALEPSRRANR